jgi:hypothetical protein
MPLPLSAFGVTYVAGSEAVVALEEAVDTYLANADAIFAELQPFLAEDSDARGRLFELLDGTTRVADALLTAADEPDDILAYVQVENFGQISEERWIGDYSRHAAVLLGLPEVSGAQAAFAGAVDEELDDLGRAGANELVAVAEELVEHASVLELLAGAEHVLQGIAEECFDQLRASLTRGWHWLMRAATKILAWVVAKAAKLVPPRLSDLVMHLLEALKGWGAGKVDNNSIASTILVRVLGGAAARNAWQAAPEGPALTAALERLPTLTDAEIRRIERVTKVRDTINQFHGKILLALLEAELPLALPALYALGGVVILFVGVQVWQGIGDIHDLAPAT